MADKSAFYHDWKMKISKITFKFIRKHLKKFKKAQDPRIAQTEFKYQSGKMRSKVVNSYICCVS